MDMLEFMLVSAGVVAWLATLGRQAMPKAERLPLKSWRLRELMSNVTIGYHQLVCVNRWRNGPTTASTRPLNTP